MVRALDILELVQERGFKSINYVSHQEIIHSKLQESHSFIKMKKSKLYRAIIISFIALQQVYYILSFGSFHIYSIVLIYFFCKILTGLSKRDVVLTKSRDNLVGKIFIDFLCKINWAGYEPTKTISWVDCEPD